MTFKFNGGRGTYLCDRCNTMTCFGLGPKDMLATARSIHAPNALVTSDKRVYCLFKCLDKRVRTNHIDAEHAFKVDVDEQIAAMNDLERELVAAHYVPIQFMKLPAWVPTKAFRTRASADIGENAIEIRLVENALELAFQEPPPKDKQIWTPLWVALVHDAGHEFFAEGAHARGFSARFESVLEAFRNDNEARAALLTAYQLGGFRATRRVLFPRYEVA